MHHENLRLAWMQSYFVIIAVDKFGENNVGLDRAGNTLLNRVNEYEKEFSKFKNAQ